MCALCSEAAVVKHTRVDSSFDSKRSVFTDRNCLNNYRISVDISGVNTGVICLPSHTWTRTRVSLTILGTIFPYDTCNINASFENTQSRNPRVNVIDDSNKILKISEWILFYTVKLNSKHYGVMKNDTETQEFYWWID